jgi:dihydrofolate reductase
MNLSIIVAVAKNRVIGARGQLPWHLSEDLKRFKKLTMGHPIVMGRKTFESIGKPLPGRENVVLTRNRSFRPEGVTVLHSFEELASRFGENEIFVIGGADLFKLALPLVTRFYLTKIEKDFEGETLFPKFDLEKDFEVVETGELKSENGVPYRFVTGVRKKPA